MKDAIFDWKHKSIQETENCKLETFFKVNVKSLSACFQR